MHSIELRSVSSQVWNWLRLFPWNRYRGKVIIYLSLSTAFSLNRWSVSRYSDGLGIRMIRHRESIELWRALLRRTKPFRFLLLRVRTMKMAIDQQSLEDAVYSTLYWKNTMINPCFVNNSKHNHCEKLLLASSTFVFLRFFLLYASSTLPSSCFFSRSSFHPYTHTYCNRNKKAKETAVLIETKKHAQAHKKSQRKSSRSVLVSRWKGEKAKEGQESTDVVLYECTRRGTIQY